MNTNFKSLPPELKDYSNWVLSERPNPTGKKNKGKAPINANAIAFLESISNLSYEDRLKQIYQFIIDNDLEPKKSYEEKYKLYDISSYDAFVSDLTEYEEPSRPDYYKKLYDRVYYKIKNASSTNPKTWCNYSLIMELLNSDNAFIKARLQEFKVNVGVVGFVLTESPFFCIDLDKCVKDGVISDNAKKYIEEIDSYTEISQSGKGLHIFGFGDALPEYMNKSNDIEIYDTGRYIALTGKVYNEYNSVNNRQDALTLFTQKYIPLNNKTTKKTDSSSKPSVIVIDSFGTDRRRQRTHRKY